jgi:DNA-binding MarR family transcriptional regulator
MNPAAATTSRSSGAAPQAASPVQEAWGLLRNLLFIERRRFLSAAGEYDLHPAQAGALMQLERDEGLPMHEIASLLACDSSNVTGIVDRLEARGLVARRVSDRDRRVKLIVPTELGLQVRDALRVRMAQVPEGLERLSPGDQELLRDLLACALHGPGPGDTHG